MSTLAPRNDLVTFQGEIVRKLNECSNALTTEEKLKWLSEVKDIFLVRSASVQNAEPVLNEVLKVVLAFQRDQTEVRMAIPPFVEDICKMNMTVFLPQCLPTMLVMSTDKSAKVLKRTVQSALSLFRPVIHFFLHSPDATMTSWEQWLELIANVAKSLWTENEALRKVAIKFTETAVLTFSTPEGSEPIAPFSLSLLDIPSRHPFMMPASIAEEGERLLSLLCQHMEQKQIETLSAESVIVSVNALGEISRLRIPLLPRVLPLVTSIAMNPGETLSPQWTQAQKRSVQITVKSNLMALLKLPHGREPATKETILRALERLGARSMASSLIQSIEGHKRNSRSESGWKESKRSRSSNMDDGSTKSKLPPLSSSSIPSTSAPTKTSTTPTVEARKLVPFEQARLVVDELKNMPLESLVQLVMSNMSYLPAVVPVAVQPEVKATSLARTEERRKKPTDPRKDLTDPRTQRRRPRENTFQPSDPRSAGRTITVKDETHTAETQVGITEKVVKKEDKVAASFSSGGGGGGGGQTTPPSLPVALSSSSTAPHAPVSRGRRTEAPPVIAPRIGVEQGRRLRDLMAERILRKEHEAEESGAIDLRLMLLGRMLASSLADPSGKEREMVGMVEKSQMGLRSKCVQFICEDLHRRIDLANQWLHAEAAAHIFKGQSNRTKDAKDEMEIEGNGEESTAQSYRDLLLVFIRHALMETEERGLLSRLLIDAPLLPKEIFDELKRACEDPGTSMVGLSTLGDLVIDRDGQDRTTALEVLLMYAICDDHVLRGPSIRLVISKLLDVRAAKDLIETFAVDSLEEKVAESGQQEDRGKVEDNKDADAGTELRVVTDGKEEMDTEPKVEANAETMMEASDGGGKHRDDGLTRRLYLFLALCAKKPTLLTKLAEVFSRSSKTDQEAILSLSVDLAKQVGASCEPLLELIREDIIPGSQLLALKMLQTLASDSKQQSPKLVEAAKNRFVSGKDSRFILPVIGSLDKSSVIQLLPLLLESMELDDFGIVIDRTTAGNPPVLLPSDLLYSLHFVDVDPTKVMKAMELCFQRRAVFKQEVLATVLQRLVDMTSLPQHFMGSIIQTARYQPKLKSVISQNILRRLVEREIWTEPSTWDDFVKAFEATMPQSVQVLLRLPPAQLQDALSRSDILRDTVKRYARESRTTDYALLQTLLEHR